MKVDEDTIYEVTKMTQETNVDLEALANAIDEMSQDRKYFLDEKTGEVIMTSAKAPIEELRRIKERFDKDPARYKIVPRVSSRDSYKDMEEFIFAVRDAKLKLRLSQAIQGEGAFKSFRDILETHTQEKEKWFEFRKDRARKRALDFLTDIGYRK